MSADTTPGATPDVNGGASFLRPVDGRILGGVCAAIARSLGIDATLVRVAWIPLAMIFGVGILLYLVLWIVIPQE